jgi:hypothetical protein
MAEVALNEVFVAHQEFFQYLFGVGALFGSVSHRSSP